MRSKAPPHHGARSMLKVHSHPLSAKWSRTVSSLNTDSKNFEAALNVFPLSDMNLWGNPLRAANLFKHLMNVSVDMSKTMSRCTALVTKQVNKQIHVLPVLLGPSVRIIKGPAKSTPVKLNAVSSFTLLTGKGGGGGAGNCAPSNSATNYTPVYDCSDQTSALHDPESPSYFCQSLSYTIVQYTLVSIIDYKRSQGVTSR